MNKAAHTVTFINMMQRGDPRGSSETEALLLSQAKLE